MCAHSAEVLLEVGVSRGDLPILRESRSPVELYFFLSHFPRGLKAQELSGKRDSFLLKEHLVPTSHLEMRIIRRLAANNRLTGTLVGSAQSQAIRA